ncbi:MAG: FAD-binding protein [Deltaproteobacteria bacterium]|nr:FAD-binding protein [Deltaproteobacteria bacterium]
MSAAQKEWDVVVVGAGVAGLIAALRARASGRSVLVVGKSGGATQAWSGSVDVADGLAGAVPGTALSGLERGEPVEDAIVQLASRVPRHPYARLGAARVNVRDAMKFLVDAVPSLGLSARLDGKNHVLATALGTVKRGALVSRTQLLDLADLPTGAVVGVVEWRDLAGFNARPVSEMLRFCCGLGVGHRVPRFVDVVVPRVNSGEVFLDNASFADALDDDAVRARFLDALKVRLASIDPAPTHLLMPAALARHPLSKDALDVVDKKLGRPLREMLALPPSVPGQRLITALRAACTAAGVDVRDAVVAAPVVTAGKVVSLEVQRGSELAVVCPRSIVLAAGRFFGGGLVRDHEAREALFGLPVVVDGLPVGDRFIGGLTDDNVDGAHAIFRAGLAVDDSLRPLDHAQGVALDGVYCAGSVIGGFDPSRDGAALGVNVWTAWLAGSLAADGAKTTGAAA